MQYRGSATVVAMTVVHILETTPIALRAVFEKKDQGALV
jgi:hypothetical protein